MANIKNRKKLQLIQTIWDVMLYSQYFTIHWKLLVLVSRIQKSGTGDNNFGKWKGTRPVTVDHLQSWSRISRSDQTEMVSSIWWTNLTNSGILGWMESASCSWRPPVYREDLSTHHNWSVKMPLLICQSGWREIRNALRIIRWVRWGREQGSRRCFVDVSNRGLITSAK